MKEVFTFIALFVNKKRNGNDNGGVSAECKHGFNSVHNKLDLHFQTHDKVLERLSTDSRESHEMMFQLSTHISQQTDILQKLVDDIINGKNKN